MADAIGLEGSASLPVSRPGVGSPSWFRFMGTVTGPFTFEAYYLGPRPGDAGMGRFVSIDRNPWDYFYLPVRLVRVI